jgi:GTP:adenosylcobinamide-phosphate guanylyltransferase
MKSISDPMPFAALVLAADRHSGDAVATAAGVECKALATVGGIPMVQRVVSTLRDSPKIERITLVGPARELLYTVPEVKQWLENGSLNWVEHAASPSASAARGLELENPQQPVLLTTADHALLTPTMVDYFLEQARQSGCDFVVGVARLETVKARFPGNRRTAIRLQGGPYCGCNLFAFMTERGHQLAPFWRRIEQERKRPWRVITGALGWSAVLRYLMGRLTLEQALERLSRKLGMRIGAVALPFAEAAVDVDTPADRQLVETTLAQRQRVEAAQP